MTAFDFEKTLMRLQESQDLASARNEYKEFCRLLKESTSGFQIPCVVDEVEGDPPGLRIRTPLGEVTGRMIIAFTDHPFAVAAFDCYRPGRDPEQVPLWSVKLFPHERWTDSAGEAFQADFTTDKYTIKVGRTTLTHILRKQMLFLNAEAGRYQTQ